MRLKKFLSRFLGVWLVMSCSALAYAEYLAPSAANLALVRKVFRAHLDSPDPGVPVKISSDIALAAGLQPQTTSASVSFGLTDRVLSRVEIKFPRLGDRSGVLGDLRISELTLTRLLDADGTFHQTISATIIGENPFYMQTVWGRSRVDEGFADYKALFSEVYTELSRRALDGCDGVLKF